MTEELQQLRAIINASIDQIIDVCNRRQQAFPSLNQPAEPSELSPSSIRNDADIRAVIPSAVAAAAQLIATLQSPTLTLTTAAAKYTLSACVGAAERTHVAEILREGNPRGMHVIEITKQNGTDPKKLARVLRYLATNHIFQEIAPDTFAHNLVSSLLDTGKNASEVIKDPMSKLDNISGITAMVSMLSIDCMKPASYLPELLSDPKKAHSQEPAETSFQIAHRFTGSRWAFLDQPENAIIARRYAAAMAGTAKLQPLMATVQGYDWKSVPSGGVVVDVGGNLGNILLEISKIRPDLQLVLEDRPLVIEKAQGFWKSNAPDFLAAGRIKLIPTDFFEPQPPLPAVPSVFLLRAILHDWSDQYASTILKNLRSVAGPDTKLIIIDTLMRYACSQRGGKDSELGAPGYEPLEAPPPLLPNFGIANILPYDLDIVMLNNLNANERTIGAFHRLLARSGWQLKEVRQNSENSMWWPIIVAEPV